MMDALNLPVKTAPEGASATKTGKGDRKSATAAEGFAQALTGSGGNGGRKAETGSRRTEADAGSAGEIRTQARAVRPDPGEAGLKAAAGRDASMTELLAATGEIETPVSSGAGERVHIVAEENGILPAPVSAKAAKTAVADRNSTEARQVPQAPFRAEPAGDAGVKVPLQDVRADFRTAGKTPAREDGGRTAEPLPVRGKDASSAQEDVQVQAVGLDDVLSLLSAAAGMPAANARAPAAETAWRKAAAAEGEVRSFAAGVLPAAGEARLSSSEEQGGNAGRDAEPGGEGRLFRLSKGEGRGQSVDLQLSGGRDGRVEAEARLPSAGQAETVNVVEARRYLGFATPVNSSALTTAISGNGEWVSAMQPGSQLANEAAFSSTGKVVNTLKLQLNPVDLGMVTATLRLAGDELSVHLTVHTAAAYRELKEDSSALLEALRGQGFSVDQVSVSMAASSDRSGNDANGQPQQQQAAQQMAGQDRSGGEAARQRGERAAHAEETAQTTGSLDDTAAEAAIAAGAGGARPDHLYI